MAANQIIINGRAANGDDVSITVKNINPAISNTVARQAAQRWVGLTTITLESVILRKDEDITQAQ